jgi:hypothetical protein
LTIGSCPVTRGRYYVSITLGDAPDFWLLVLLLDRAFGRCVVVLFPKTSFSLYVKFFHPWCVPRRGVLGTPGILPLSALRHRLLYGVTAYSI